MSTFGNYLKNIRNEKGLSLAAVHKQTGITNSRLHRAENDTGKPLSRAEIKKLASLYDVSVISMYIMAGYLDESDLEQYRSGFKNIHLLDPDEKEHVQGEIDFLIRRKG